MRVWLIVLTALYICPIITAYSTLRQLHIVFRHGERTPSETYKNDPYKDYFQDEGQGQLTKRGKLQMYTLGTQLREWYSDFVPSNYFPTDLEIISSYADRCLMSAELLLAGLFPPKDELVWNKELLWQPIPIRSIPRGQDKIIAMKAACNKYDKTLKDLQSSEWMQELNCNNSDLFEYLSRTCGQTINNIGDVEKLYNTLEIELMHNLSLPTWTQNVSFEHLKNLSALSLESFVKTPYMKRMKGGMFLQEMIKSSENSSAKMFLYSGHDVTLVNILKTLGYKSILKPNFAACFIVEIRSDNEIRMIYREDGGNSTELIQLEGCPNQCYVDKFVEMLKPLIPLDWDKECENIT